jgi:hypothetical protein
MNPRCAAGFFLAVLLAPPSAAAQTLVGRVVEEGRENPVTGALVSLVGRDGEPGPRTITDSLGQFVLAPGRDGEYVVEATRFGYETTRSPLFAMTVEGSVSLDLVMHPLPLGLEGLEVSVDREAEELLRPFGHSPTSLGRRWIDRQTLDKIGQGGHAGDVISWQGLAGVYVPLGTICVTHQRGRTGAGSDRCALIVLDGAIIPMRWAAMIDHHDLEAIVVLGPMEATTFYGTAGGGGAVLLWTRRGRR